MVLEAVQLLLPVPRNPESTVTGRRLEGLAVSSMATVERLQEQAEGMRPAFAAMTLWSKLNNLEE
jgi:hypothetical protein